MTLTRQSLRHGLAVLWLIDAALQCQPFMFGHGFANDVLRPAGDGQPAVVAAPVHLLASIVATQPALFNGVFAVVQLALAVGLLFRRSARAALAASIVWSLGVWSLGEGFGGLLSGHAMLLTGAPGAALLYAALAIVAWPAAAEMTAPRAVSATTLRRLWAAVWLGGAVLQTLPGQNSGAAVAGAIRDSADGAPGWLAHADTWIAGRIPHGTTVVVALVALQALVGAAALVPGFTRTAALIGGGSLLVAFWLFGQSLGELTTGAATDPQTAPLLIAVGVALAGARTSRPKTAGPALLTPNKPVRPSPLARLLAA
jgi:hypothetical protein